MASFYQYLPLLLRVEGGYQKHPQDSGNYNSRGELVGTNYGISAPVDEDWIGRPPSEADMRSMQKQTAQKIYKEWFWNRIGAGQIKNQSLANIIADHAVNAGIGGAGRLVQRVLNEDFGFSLAVDGMIGPKTRAAINSVDAELLHNAIFQARKEFYLRIGGVFAEGWLIRLGKFVFEKKKWQSD